VFPSQFHIPGKSVANNKVYRDPSFSN